MSDSMFFKMFGSLMAVLALVLMACLVQVSNSRQQDRNHVRHCLRLSDAAALRCVTVEVSG